VSLTQGWLAEHGANMSPNQWGQIIRERETQIYELKAKIAKLQKTVADAGLEDPTAGADAQAVEIGSLGAPGELGVPGFQGMDPSMLNLMATGELPSPAGVVPGQLGGIPNFQYHGVPQMDDLSQAARNVEELEGEPAKRQKTESAPHVN